MKDAASVGMAILLGLLALAGIASAPGGGAPLQRRTDLNDDGVVNSGDQYILACDWGAHVDESGGWQAGPFECPLTLEATWVPSPSLTAIASASLTPTTSATPPWSPTASASATPSIRLPLTSTPTPTPTSPPSAYTVEDLIFDTTGDHDGDLCGVEGFDWEFNGRVGLANAPGGTDQYTLWGTIQWVSCGASTPNTHYETRNLRGWIRQGSSWLAISGVSGAFEWCDVRDPDTTNGSGGSCPGSDYPGNPSDFLAPTGVRSLHWASFRRSFPGGSCIVVVYEARSTGGAIMANAGADWIDNGQIVSDAFLGRYKRLSGDWRHVGGSSCSASLLRSSPPPGF